jgi:cation diffusion facilitator family transporter
MAGTKTRTASVSVFAAAVLVALKLVTGLVIGSLGLVSAGIESSGDLVAAILTLVAIRIGGRPADADHPYGHARAENLAALGEAAILYGGAGFIVLRAIEQLTSAAPPELHPSGIVFAVIGIAIVIDVSRTVVSYRSARVYRSAALRSNAFHFGGDLLGTVAVLIGLLFARSGYGHADAIAALVVAAIIAAAATRLTLENVRSLMDQALPESEAIVRRAIEGLKAPVAVELTRLREAGGQHFVELVATVPPAAAVSEAHILSDAIEQAVEQALPGSDVIVHVEPARSDADLHERVLGAALSVGSVREVHNLAVVDLGDGLEASLHLKFPADVALTEAHAVATRVEGAIRDAAPEILRVHTHLEPIKQAITGSGQNLDDDDLLDADEQEIRRILLDETPPPRQLHVFRTAHGLVVHATLVVADATLQEAHSRATELEGRIRATDAHIHDIVIHTEP